MSDQSDVPATEPEEAAQAAATEPASTPPWGDDFDAERAWKTIQNLRQFEKQAKEFERIQSDDEARAEWLKSQGYEFAEDEGSDTDDEELFDEDEDPRFQKLSELEKRAQAHDEWIARQEREREQAAIRADLDSLNADTGWELDDHDRAVIEVWARGKSKGENFTKAELEQAHKEYIDRLEGYATRAVERAKKPKPKAPHVPTTGQAATEVEDLDDHQARVRHMVERMRGGPAG